MNDREIMQQAMEAMLNSPNDISDEMFESIRVLRARLAQPERHELQAKGEHPAPCARHCEANAFEIVIKNLKAQLEQPEQEPVAWKHNHIEGVVITHRPADINRHPDRWTALDTAPPQRKPLTDKELADLWYKQSTDWMEFARAIEAAHGIKEKNT